MNLRNIHTYLMAFGLMAIAHAATASVINLSGKIVDANDKPVPEVELSLQSAKLSSTTNSQGAWSFVRGTTQVLRHSFNNMASESSRKFDLKGRQLGVSFAHGISVAHSSSMLRKEAAAEDLLIVSYKDLEIARIPVPDLDAGMQESMVLGKYTVQFSPAAAGASTSAYALLGFSTDISFNYDATLWNPIRFIINGSSSEAEGDTYSVILSRNNSIVTLELQNRTQELEFPSISSKVYGDIFTVTTLISSGLPVQIASQTKSVCTVDGKIVSLVGTGTCKLTASQSGNDTLNAVEITRSFTVTKKTLTISGLSAADKQYDGTTKATVTGTLTGVVGKDDVQLVLGTATFADKTVGTAKKVTLAGTKISGNDAGQYTLGTIAALTASITPKRLITTNVQAENKVYDGNDTVYSISADLDGVISGDEVEADLSDCFYDNPHSGLRNISCKDAKLKGKDAANYTRTKAGSISREITKRKVTFSATTFDKPYDGNSIATIDNVQLMNLLPQDYYVSVYPYPAKFSQTTPGDNIPLTFTNAYLSNNYYNDYELVLPTLTANITKRSITVRPYDKSKTYGEVYIPVSDNSCYLTSGSFIGSDGISFFTLSSDGFGYTAPRGQYVSSMTNLVGTNLEYYDITYETGNFSVNPKPMTISVHTLEKVYNDQITLDGKLALFVSSGLFVNGDQITSITGTSPGTDKSALPGDYPIDFSISAGTGLANYEFTLLPGTLTVKKRPVTIEWLANAPSLTKQYDGSTNMDIQQYQLTKGVHYVIKAGPMGTTDCSTNFLSTSLTDKDAGNRYAHFNYDGILTCTNPEYFELTPGILPAPVTVTKKPVDYTIADKVYDGTTATTVSFSGVVPGDDAEPWAQASFGTADVGSNKGVTLLYFSIVGQDAGNYEPGTGNTSANITIATASISVTPPPAKDLKLNTDGVPLEAFTGTFPFGIPLSYSSATPTICAVNSSSGFVTFPSVNGNYEAGLCEITVSYSGSLNYKATSTSVSFNVYGVLHSTDPNEPDYRTTRIGNVVWMAENLNYDVPGFGYCPQNYDCSEFGRFYDHANSISACPDGWRIPASKDFDNLQPFMEGSTASLRDAFSLWTVPGTNTTGFSAKPGGILDINSGNVSQMGALEILWADNSMFGGMPTTYKIDNTTILMLSVPPLTYAHIRCIRN